MKKIQSQIYVGIVCVLLAFMITYQLKSVMNQNKELDEKKNAAQITLEIDQLKKQKDKLRENIDELQTQIKSYENAASNKSDMTKEIVKKLEDSRMLTGSVDVEGEGIIAYITPQKEFFTGNSNVVPIIKDYDIIKIINELNAADAEAVSVNDIRITSRTGIRSASNYITINNERIPSTKRITIKAIGNKTNLKKPLEFPGGVLDELKQIGIDVKYEESSNIKIQKNNESLKFQYARPINTDK
ncbi:DUF881 domain-containing protein [Clostridium botulinum]|uniref:Dihydropteridine reductase n=1 Tax=Clostridium botulinum C/D str. DC5 TaxID=1443128 RepID=A0A0A0IQV0_CLOBO|nr:DUF881 domain-containing protein [Clostridium botulinum]KEI02113.1 dihydropteridine reductase [Clostridium botulinum C/D str. BKT75002]KEI09463.1 dihydropteridine reductase [Clostridium botulinum C/D str. BKT2873]KGM96649.1 dihydropteridine reductase [Clostridium botulinum D str. CCUG 7971]KGN01891.1 dihydropteridine reductase [Clostridium botulinum C/D str. DC5]KOC48527.1 dihydropteridine reductase [Clostridium botulinum]